MNILKLMIINHTLCMQFSFSKNSHLVSFHLKLQEAAAMSGTSCQLSRNDLYLNCYINGQCFFHPSLYSAIEFFMARGVSICNTAVSKYEAWPHTFLYISPQGTSFFTAWLLQIIFFFFFALSMIMILSHSHIVNVVHVYVIHIRNIKAIFMSKIQSGHQSRLVRNWVQFNADQWTGKNAIQKLTMANNMRMKI